MPLLSRIGCRIFTPAAVTQSPVGIFPVSDTDERDHLLLLSKFVNDPVVSDPHAIGAIGTMELPRSRRDGILSESFNCSQDARNDLSIQILQLVVCG